MQTYKTAATARRGAFRQKLNPNSFTVEETTDGLWFIKTSEPDPLPQRVPSEPAPKPAAKATKTKVISRVTKGETKRAPKRQHSSTASSPVAFIWHWLAQDDNASMKRADAIAELVKLGIASGTASTQRFRFLNASPAERAARAARAQRD